MLYCIGDVHGMLNKFELLWEKVQVTKKDTVIMLGDFIDRGPDAKGVLDAIMDRQKNGYNIITLMGNHEHMALASIEKRSILGMRSDEVQAMWLFPRNGGPATLKSFGITIPDDAYDKNDLVSITIDDKYIDFMKSCKLMHETSEYIFVHAGLRPNGKNISTQDPEDLLWIRDAFIRSQIDFGKKVIFGHTTTNYINPDGSFKPYKDRFKIGIDTGCVFNGGMLTCVRLPDEEFISV